MAEDCTFQDNQADRKVDFVVDIRDSVDRSEVVDTAEEAKENPEAVAVLVGLVVLEGLEELMVEQRLEDLHENLAVEFETLAVPVSREEHWVSELYTVDLELVMLAASDWAVLGRSLGADWDLEVPAGSVVA